MKSSKNNSRHSLLNALLFLALLASACEKKQTSQAELPVVEVMRPEARDIPIATDWVAVTDGFVDATIRAQVQGYLIKQNYNEGDFVHKGQSLFEIDPRPFEAALAQAGAALGQAKAEVTRNEAQLFVARANLNRIQPLLAQKVVSQQDLDNATGQEKAAAASLAAAQAAVKVAEAALEKTRLDLSFTKIISPIDGIAGFALKQIGDLVGPAQTGELTTVSTLDPIKVYFKLDELAYMKYVRKYQADGGIVEHNKSIEYRLVLADGSLHPSSGTFNAIDREVDPQTGTLRVEMLFPNPGNGIRPGQFARVRALETKKGALLVPQRAVMELQGVSQLAILGMDNKVEIRTVKPGSRVGTHWVIDEGLKPGERVVVEGLQKIRQGMTVQPRESAAPSNAKPEDR